MQNGGKTAGFYFKGKQGYAGYLKLNAWKQKLGENLMPVFYGHSDVGLVIAYFRKVF